MAKYEKGQGGRPKGVANKITRDVRSLAQALFDEAYWARTKAKIVEGTIHPMIEKTLLAYAYGEPKKTLKVEGEIGIAEKRGILRDLPEAVVQQLAARVAFEAEADDSEETVN